MKSLFVCAFILCAGSESNAYEKLMLKNTSKAFVNNDDMLSIVDYAFAEPAWRDIVNSKGRLDNIDQTDGFYSNYFYEILKEWQIIFVSNWIPIKLTDGRTAFTDGMILYEDKKMILKVHKCIGDSAILHELGHIIRQNFDLLPDNSHKDYEFWMLIKWMEERMINNFCPKNYVKDRY